MNSNYEYAIKSKVTYRFSSITDRALDDDRVSFNIPNTSLYINFVVCTNTESDDTELIITNQMIKNFSLSIEDLIKYAHKNTCKKEPVYLKNLAEIIGVESTDNVQSIIVSNQSLYYGAIAILYDGVYDFIKERIGDFYILPLSIHEVICVPKRLFDKEDLLRVVRSVNEELFMNEKDVLADDIFEMHDGMIRSSFVNDM